MVTIPPEVIERMQDQYVLCYDNGGLIVVDLDDPTFEAFGIDHKMDAEGVEAFRQQVVAGGVPLKQTWMTLPEVGSAMYLYLEQNKKAANLAKTIGYDELEHLRRLLKSAERDQGE